MQESHSDLVELAKSRLSALLGMVGAVDVPVTEQATADLLVCLGELHAQYERDGEPHSGRGRHLESVDIEEAWRLGMAPDGADLAPGHAYPEKLAELRRRSVVDPAAFEALALHAGEMIAEDRHMPVPLRRFVLDYLTGKTGRPRSQGRLRKTVLPDLAIAEVVAELVEIHGIKAVGNVGSEHEGSACAIVAQAMTDLGRQPSSFSAIAKAWFALKGGKDG